MDRKDIMNKCMSYIKAENLSKLDYIFELDRIGIAKQFFKETMGLDAELQPFEELKSNLCDIVRHMKIQFPDNEIDFYTTVYERLMFLKGLPKDEYYILLKKADMLYKKVADIRNNIIAEETKLEKLEKRFTSRAKLLSKKIDKLQKNCQPYNRQLNRKERIAVDIFPIIEYRKRKTKHYRQLLENEYQDIQKIDLREKAVFNCSRTMADDDHYYKYDLSTIEKSEELFLPTCDHSISVKFTKELKEFIGQYERNFDAKKFKEANLKYEYHSDKVESLRVNTPDKYIEFLSDYIQEKNVYEYIHENVKNNHVINKRLEVIDTALNCYKDKSYLSFVNIAAIQVEGIFYDYCFEMGIQPDRIDSFALNTKLDELKKKDKFNAYEYFAFDFPIMRNKVAHGLMTDTSEIEKIAHETFLDLQYLVYDFQTNRNFPFHGPLEFVERYKNAETTYGYVAKIQNTKVKDECLYSHLNSNNAVNNIQWLLNPMYDKIHNFYNLTSDVVAIRNHFFRSDFLDFLDVRLKDTYSVQRQFPIDSTRRLDNLNTWLQLLQVVICYCKEYRIVDTVSNKVKGLRGLVEKMKEGLA